MVDFKSINDIESMMNERRARKVLSEILNADPNWVLFSRHGLRRMKEREIFTVDVMNILKGGNIYDPPEFERGSWRYRVETSKMVIVVAFRNPHYVTVVSGWRK